MAAKSEKSRICKNKHCKLGGIVFIESQEYVKDKIGFYHAECYKEKKDLMLVRDLWIRYINNTVVISELNKVLYELIDRPGITAAYLLFVLQYVIAKGYKLNYPKGFLYYVDSDEIKAAYSKKQIASVSKHQFVAKRDDDEPDMNKPLFANISKPTGFGSILGGKHK